MTLNMVVERSSRDRTLHQLCAYYPEDGVLTRLLTLEAQFDPLDVFDGVGTPWLLDQK